MAKYVVVEKGWEYNDEYNSLHDDGSYSIVTRLYSSRTEAELIGMPIAISKLFSDYNGKFNSSNFDFSSFYCESYDSDALIEFFKINNFEYDDHYDLSLPPDLPLETCIEAYNISELNLFDIIEIEE